MFQLRWKVRWGQSAMKALQQQHGTDHQIPIHW
jgi:hypothetical protein